MKTARECLEEMGWFLNKEAVFCSTNFEEIVYDNLVYSIEYVSMFDDSISYWDGPDFIYLSEEPLYPTQKPIRVNYIGANSSDDDIYYLVNDEEGKAEYENSLLTESVANIKKHRVVKQRKM